MGSGWMLRAFVRGSLNKLSLALIAFIAIPISGRAQKTSIDRCEFAESDPKGNLFLMKEFDRWEIEEPGAFLTTYRMSPLLKKDSKTGKMIANFDGKQDSQSMTIMEVMVPFFSSDQAASKEKGLKELREYAMGPEGLGEDIDAIPCEPESIRVCAVAEPFPPVDHELWMELNPTKAAEFSKIKGEKEKEQFLRKLFRRIRTMRIEHCLTSEKIPERDRDAINKACDEKPEYTPDEDRGYPSTSEQFRRCGAAIKAYLDKQKDIQKSMPLNERGKYVPKTEHKK